MQSFDTYRAGLNDKLQSVELWGTKIFVDLSYNLIFGEPDEMDQ